MFSDHGITSENSNLTRVLIDTTIRFPWFDRLASKSQHNEVSDTNEDLNAMPTYDVGFIFGRCHLQKPIRLASGAMASPLGPSGHTGALHDVRTLLHAIRFPFTREDLDASLENFRAQGHCALVTFPPLDAPSFELAIELSNSAADAAAGALAVISANPVVALCAVARSSSDSGIKHFAPIDRTIFHGTNLPGYLDALPALEAKALEDPKFATLLLLYRASLYDGHIDHQLLFQLVLLESASKDEEGTSLAGRMRALVNKYGLAFQLDSIAAENGITPPSGKDMLDAIVCLRNAAAHTGRIDAAGLNQYGGAWLVPSLDAKSALHRAIGDSLRMILCSIAGHSPEAMATLVTAPFAVQFD